MNGLRVLQRSVLCTVTEKTVTGPENPINNFKLNAIEARFMSPHAQSKPSAPSPSAPAARTTTNCFALPRNTAAPGTGAGVGVALLRKKLALDAALDKDCQRHA